jgi:hypothetical protein
VERRACPELVEGTCCIYSKQDRRAAAFNQTLLRISGSPPPEIRPPKLISHRYTLHERGQTRLFRQEKPLRSELNGTLQWEIRFKL